MAADFSSNRAAGNGGGGGDSDPRTSAPLKVARINQEPSGWEQGEAAEEMEFDRQSLDEWAKDKPLSILQLDPADRAVLKIAGMMNLGGKEVVEGVPGEHTTIACTARNVEAIKIIIINCDVARTVSLSHPAPEAGFAFPN